MPGLELDAAPKQTSDLVLVQRLDVGSSRMSTCPSLPSARRSPPSAGWRPDSSQRQRHVDRDLSTLSATCARFVHRRPVDDRARIGKRPMKMFSATDRFGQRLT